MQKPLIISAAITGGGRPKQRGPQQPVLPAEIVAEAIACWHAGAAIAHIHARDDSGETTSDPARHVAIRDAIRAGGCDIIVNFSAGDDGGKADHETRLSIVRDGGGEMASLSCGSFNVGRRLYDNRPEFLQRSALMMRDFGVRPEVEVIDTGNMYLVDAFVREGLIPRPSLVQFGFGLPGGMPARTALLDQLVESLPPGLEWGVICQSPRHEDYLRMAMAAFTRGGHVRTGIEDIAMVNTSDTAANNAELVHQWAQTARIWGRPIASPGVARQMLGFGGR
jgi:3-keto-5-aminohexanoate cleavage enzyme